MMMNSRRLAANGVHDQQHLNRAVIVSQSPTGVTRYNQLQRRKRLFTAVIVASLIGYPSAMGISKLFGAFDRRGPNQGER